MINFIRLGLLFIFLLSAFSVFGQTHSVSFDFLGLFGSRKNISFERSFINKFSGRLAYENQIYTEGERNGQMVYEVHGKGVIPELRYYPFHNSKPAPLGFFIGTSFRYVKVTEVYTPLDIESEGTVFNYTLISGYKFNFDRAIIEILGGYGSGTVNGLDDSERSQIDPFFSNDTIDGLKGNLRIEISIGFYFPEIK